MVPEKMFGFYAWFWLWRKNGLTIRIVVLTLRMSKTMLLKSVTLNSGAVPWRAYVFDVDA